MAEEHLQTSIAVNATDSHHEVKKDLISPDGTMVLLTWVTFFALLATLNKFAFKPILANLDAREQSIRKAVEDADKAKEELAKINETRAKMFAEAELKARDMLEQSRKAAIEAAKAIEHKARGEAQILIENALREIKVEQQKAQAILREESAQIIVQLSSKLIQENLDNKKNRELIDKLIKSI